MAIRNIRLDKDPILRKISREVTSITPNIITLIQDMKETMEDAEGVGLAAPQVGVLRRVIVMNDYNGTERVMINPVIEKGIGKVPGIEGCLSVPGYQGTVERMDYIQVSYMDSRGEKIVEEFRDFPARILQHELDHLNGILYTDKAENLREFIEPQEEWDPVEEEVL